MSQPKAERGASQAPLRRPKKEANGTDDDADDKKAPHLEYRDLPLRSMDASSPWIYHVMRLAHHSRIDPCDTTQFVPPLKLNRKQPPRPKADPPREGDAVLDKYGKPITINVPITAPDGSGTIMQKTPLTWPAPGADVSHLEQYINSLKPQKGPTADASLIAPTATNAAQRKQAKHFQKRVREIHKSSATARRTFNQEYLPWVLEDYEADKEWESARTLPPVGLAALEADLERRKEGLGSVVQPAAPTDNGVKKEDDSGVVAMAVGTPGASSSTANHAPWIGKLEGDNADGGTHLLLVFDERPPGGFIVVPVSKMYKFLQKPKHAGKMTAEEAEKEFEKHQKARIGEADRWLMRVRSGESSGSSQGSGGRASSSRSAMRVKKEESDASILSAFPELGGSLVLPGGGYSGARFGPDGSRSLRVANAERPGRGRSGVKREPDSGTWGELDFEEDFADDDERIEGEQAALDDDEAKELEEKLKREMAMAGAAEGAEEDADDLFDGAGEDDVLTGSGRQIRKIMRALGRHEGNEAYERDDDAVNPYASDDESDDEDTVMANPEKALREVREERERLEKEAKQQAQQSAPQSKVPSEETSRSNTPGGRAEKKGGAAQQQMPKQHRPGAGHANLAHRATSPKRTMSASSAASKVASRSGSRSGSPGAGVKRSRAESGGDVGNGGDKRAKLGDASSRGSRDASPRAPLAPGSRQPDNDIEAELIELVRTKQVSDMKQIVAKFGSRVKKEPSVKELLMRAVKKIVVNDAAGGGLRLREGY